MTVNTPKKHIENIPNKGIKKVELLRPWVVKIPYTMNGRRLDLVVYKEETGWFSIRVNEFHNNTWIRIKNKDEILPKRETNRIYETKEQLNKKIGEVLDYYIGKKRLRIPQKVDEAYKLLIQEKIEKKTEQKKQETKKEIKNTFEWEPKEAEKIADKAKKIFGKKSIKETEKILTETKDPKKKKVFNKMWKLALALWITWSVVLAIWKLWHYEAKKKQNEEIKNKIEMAEKNQQKITPEKTIERNDAVEQVKSQEKIKEEIPPTITTGKTNTIVKTSALEIQEDFSQDEVFVLIDKHDSKIDPNRYSNWKALSEQEQSMVKNIYEQVMSAKTKTEVENVISNIQSLKITRGLRDVLVKKTFILEKKEKNVTHLQMAGKINIERELAIVDQLVEKTENMVLKYMPEPSIFAIAAIPWTWHSEYLDNAESTIRVYFTLQKQWVDIGQISFDTNGNLLTQNIEYNNTKYILSQNGNMISVTEGYLTNN